MASDVPLIPLRADTTQPILQLIFYHRDNVWIRSNLALGNWWLAVSADFGWWRAGHFCTSPFSLAMSEEIEFSMESPHYNPPTFTGDYTIHEPNNSPHLRASTPTLLQARCVQFQPLYVWLILNIGKYIIPIRYTNNGLPMHLCLYYKVNPRWCGRFIQMGPFWTRTSDQDTKSRLRP